MTLHEILKAVFIQGAGPLTFLGFLAWAYSLWQIRPRDRAERAAWYWPIGLGLLGAAWAFGSVSVDFKVLSDETNLLSVANMLAFFGKASNTESWLYYYHTYHPLDIQVPTRPVLFPLFTSIVHAVAGVAPRSPFVVNFICLSALIALAVRWARAMPGPAYVNMALGFFACLMSPVLLINATSAGYDVCSLLFGFLAFTLYARFVARRDDASLVALFLTLFCFASVRYESIVALPLVAVGVWWLDRRRPIPYGLYAAIGVLLVPVFLQRYLTWGSFENPPGVAPFSPAHFRDHFVPFVKAFFLDANGPYPILLHWAGLAGFALVVKGGREDHLLPLGYGVFLFVLLLSHHFGFAGHPTQARLFLQLSFALSLLGLYALARAGDRLDARVVLAVFALLTLHHQTYARHDPLMTQLTMTREMRHLRDFLAAAGKPGDLFVYDRPGQLSALGLSAVSWNDFHANQAGYLENRDKNLYGRIIMIDRPQFKGQDPETALVRRGYQLRPFVEHQLTPDERLRVSELSRWPAASL